MKAVEMTIDDESSIYVGGLPYDATEDSVRRVFDSYGEVVAVKVRPTKVWGWFHSCLGLMLLFMVSLIDGFDCVVLCKSSQAYFFLFWVFCCVIISWENILLESKIALVNWFLCTGTNWIEMTNSLWLICNETCGSN